MADTTEIDAQMTAWMRAHKRGGYVRAYLSIRRHNPESLGWCDLEDLRAIFSALREQEERADQTPAAAAAEADQLAALFAGMKVGQ